MRKGELTDEQMAAILQCIRRKAAFSTTQHCADCHKSQPPNSCQKQTFRYVRKLLELSLGTAMAHDKAINRPTG